MLSGAGSGSDEAGLKFLIVWWFSSDAERLEGWLSKWHLRLALARRRTMHFLTIHLCRPLTARFRWISFEEAIETGSIVSLHCPPLEDGVQMFSGSVLEQLQEGCCLVNTARATLVDERAVLDSLENG